MASYKVLSGRIAGKKAGDIVTAQDLEGCNIAALVEAGHLSEETTKPTKADKE